MFAVAGAAILLLFRIDKQRLEVGHPGVRHRRLPGRILGPAVRQRLAYTNNMGWEKIVEFHKTLLFPDTFTWVLVLAVHQRDRVGLTAPAPPACSSRR